MIFHPNFNRLLIPGLRYIPNFITPQEKTQLLKLIDQNQWDCTLLRRQQHYGMRYFQTSHLLPTLQPAQTTSSPAPFPLTPFEPLISRLISLNIFQRDDPPNQCLVNEYLKHTKLSLHVENEEAFGQVICGVSLGGPEWLRLDRHGSDEVRLMLEDGSAYVMQGEARKKWRHGIGRKDVLPVVKDHNWRRVSLTFRHVLETRRKLQ